MGQTDSMTESIRPVRMNHLNAVVENYDASVSHLRRVFGAELMVEFPQKEWRACLVSIGRVIIELFVPYDFLLNSRQGPHWLGIEYQSDMTQVRAAVASYGIRIVRDIGVALHTHPADCFGMAFEFYDGSFHERDWPDLGGQIKPAEYWRDEHALGLTGLKAYTAAVNDLGAATSFLRRFLSAQIVYELERPNLAARAVGLQVADDVIEVLAPVRDGALQAHLWQHGQGIRSIVFGVRDLDQARRYFAELDMKVVPGSMPDSFMLAAEENLGLAFEFAL
jgi:hypothetical protein